MKSCARIFTHLGLGLAIAGGLIYSSVLVTRSMERMRGNIDVKGYAERSLNSDYVNWSINVTSRDANLATSYKDIERQKNAVLAFLKNAGVKDMKLEVGPVYKTTLYQRDESGNSLSNVSGFELAQNIAITTGDIASVKKLALDITKLGEDGIEIEARAPSYLVKRETLEALKVELLAEATRSAKERADQFAHNSGAKIGALTSARQGVFQLTSPDATDVSDYGTYDTSSDEKIMKIVVTLSYNVES